GGTVRQSQGAGHRNGGMTADDTDTSGTLVSAAYGELEGYDAGAGRLFHRAWWHQGPSTNAGGTAHPLVGIGGGSLGGGLQQLDAGGCTRLDVIALDSDGQSASPAEDVLLSYDTSSAGAFYLDPQCSTASPFVGAILVPSGQTTAPVFFMATASGQVTLTAPD